MNELVKEKVELLLKDLEDMQKLEKETGKQHFTLQLFAIRVKEIYEILRSDDEDKCYYDQNIE